MSRKRKNEFRSPSDLKPHPLHVVRVHPAKKVELLAKGISEFGFTVPVILDENDVILAGYAKALAAQKLGIQKIPVVVLTGLSEARKRAYVLFDNKISEHSTYDWPALADELKDLANFFPPMDWISNLRDSTQPKSIGSHRTFLINRTNPTKLSLPHARKP